MPRLDKIFKFREGEDNPDAVKPFLDHLEDLRWTLVKAAITLIIGMVVAFAFRGPLVEVVQRPLHQVNPNAVQQLQVLSVTDPLVIIFEVSFYAGIVITFPILLFYVAQFVLPALTRHERKIVLPAIGVSFALFGIGVLFCYFCVLPQTLRFFYSFATSLEWTPKWQVRQYFAFVTQMTVAFGLAFELPIVVLLLVYLRVLTSGFLRRTRPFAIVIILVLAMIIAPTPDLVTFLSLGVPMCVLYEACIWLGWFVERMRLKKENAA
ncbi:MAG: twin-arginine translocase subunit TatC [Chthoniobacteraceae bacterium]|jgi:sec-independent protein translocase protein TatC